MSRHVHRLVARLTFPVGLRPGAGKDASNRLLVDTDGLDRPVLRGTAIAGALRHAVAKARKVRSSEVSRWFGVAADRKEGNERGSPSSLRVADVVLDSPAIITRHHVAIDRHRGAALASSLFDVDALLPGTQGTMVLELHGEDPEEARTFLIELVSLLSGLTLGGNAARGIGRVEVSGARLRHYDLAVLEEHAAFLDERYSREYQPSENDAVLAIEPSRSDRLTVEIVLRVPRGQDFLVGDGQALDCQIEPQRVRDKNGEEVYWRLPGSSLRGVLRGWVTRLARREELARGDHVGASSVRTDAVCDTVDRYLADKKDTKGAELGWCYDSDERRKEKLAALEGASPKELPEHVRCPVSRLFGSLYSRGRVHVSDALAQWDDDGVQRRVHVAVDRVTGGANEGALFENDVLPSSKKLQFKTFLIVESPTEAEARWLAASLRAIDRGLVRIGSSKAGGRLALAEAPTATGIHKEFFENLEPSEINHV